MSFYSDNELNKRERQFDAANKFLEHRDSDLNQHLANMDINKDIIVPYNARSDALRFKHERENEKDDTAYGRRPVAADKVMDNDKVPVRKTPQTRNGGVDNNKLPVNDKKENDVGRKDRPEIQEEPDAVAQIGAPREPKNIAADDSPGTIYAYIFVCRTPF